MEFRKKILALIPARGGSKRLPRKNLKILGDKPLLGWTVEAARKSKYISKIILSSEDSEIIEVAKRSGCEVPFVRPLSLATDTATSMDVIFHALDEVPGFEYLLLLQPTSPLRTTAHIDEFIERFFETKRPAGVSVNEETGALNGALYIAENNWLRKSQDFITEETWKYPMAADLSVDVDTLRDWQKAEELLKNRFS